MCSHFYAESKKTELIKQHFGGCQGGDGVGEISEGGLTKGTTFHLQDK